MRTRALRTLLVLALAGLLAGGCIISSGSSPCDGVTCSYHGTCIEVGGLAECACDSGYVNDGPLRCVPGTGDIRFSWAFGPHELGCLGAGVGRVRIEVYDLAGNLEFEVQPIPDCLDQGATLTHFDIGTWNLFLQGICDVDLSVGYELDANLVVEHTGINDYGLVVLSDVGGCP